MPKVTVALNADDNHLQAINYIELKICVILGRSGGISLTIGARD
jgi:hypothetical protein